MNTATKPDTAKSSPAALAITAVVQVAIVLLVTVVLMFALRGAAAPEEDQQRWQLAMEAPAEGEPPPVLDTWESLDAMLAAAPEQPFVEHVIAVDDDVFLLMAPADATIETPDNNSRIRVTLNPNAAIDFGIGRFDKQREMDHLIRVHGDIHSFPFAGDKALILEHTDEEEKRYEGVIDATAGLYQLTAETDNPDGDYSEYNTLAECQLLLKIGQSLKLKEPLPTETIPLLNRLGHRFSPDTTDPLEITFVRPRDSCTPAQLELLEKLPNVERLNMHGIGHAPEYFVHIGKCKKLKELEVSNLWIDDECLEHLAGCGELKSFETGLTDRVTAKGFEAFKQLPNLKNVRLGDVDEKAVPGLSGLAAAQGLETLSFDLQGEARLLNLGSDLDFLGDLPNLKNLEISSLSPYLQDANLAFCSKLSQLETLDLSHYAGGDDGIKHMAAMTSLKNLTMDFSDDTMITTDGIAVLAGLPSLEALEVDDIPLTDEMIAPFAQSNIKSLNIDSCKLLTLDGLLQLKEMPNLERLQMSDDLLTDEEMTKLKEALPDVNIVAY